MQICIDIFEEIGSNWLKLIEIGLNGVEELSMFVICKSQVHSAFDMHMHKTGLHGIYKWNWVIIDSKLSSWYLIIIIIMFEWEMKKKKSI